MVVLCYVEMRVRSSEMAHKCSLPDLDLSHLIRHPFMTAFSTYGTLPSEHVAYIHRLWVTRSEDKVPYTEKRSLTAACGLP